MKLLLAIAGLAGGGLLLLKSVTGATWAQVLSGQAEQVYKNGQQSVTVPAADIVTATGGGTLNKSQLTFAQQLSADTGLSLPVVEGWVHSEEPATAAQAPNGANNWLNIGATNSGYAGGGNPAWDNPINAANQTAAWLEGGDAPGFGHAASGIRDILASAGKSVDAQVAAIRASGWSTSGYPQLAATVGEYLK